MKNKCDWKIYVGGSVCIVVAGWGPHLIETRFYIEDWDAAWFQAVGSLLAVSVALLYPIFTRNSELKNIRYLIEFEMNENNEKLRPVFEKGDVTAPDGNGVIPYAQIVEAIAKNVDLRAWEKHGPMLSLRDVSSYMKYRRVNQYAEALIEARNQQHPGFKAYHQTNAVKSFLEAYSNEFSPKTKA